MNAEGLAHIMNDLFGNVVYAGIDTINISTLSVSTPRGGGGD